MKDVSNTIFLSLTNEPFARVKKKLLDDPTISFTAKGIMAYLLGKKNGWKLRVFDLVNHSTEGERAIRTAVNELRAAGYISYERPKTISSEGVWKVADSRMFPRHCCFSNGGARNGVNGTLSKNDCTKNDSSKNRCLKETAISSPCSSKPEIESEWKPDGRSKAQLLAALPVPRSYPSQHEFDAWVEENAPDVSEYRGDLYSELCYRKWRNWDARANKWIPIRDWKKFVAALDETIIEAKHN